MDHTARTAKTARNAKRREGRKEKELSFPSGFLSVFSVVSALLVTCLATTPAQSVPAPWPQVYDGLSDSSRKMLYAGACDFSVPAFVDIDGDGDLDLFVGQDKGFPIYLRNDGTSRAPEWTFVSQFYDLPALSSSPSRATPAFADVDGDGTMDLALGLANGRIAYYHNKGTPTRTEWELVSQDWLGRAVSTNARPAFADIDADGDLDLFVGGQDGCIAFFRNDGTAQAPSRVYVVDNYMNIAVGGAASPAFCDIDGDGDYDLFVGNALGRVYFYRNFGTPQLGFFWTPESNHYAGLDVPKNAAPTLADMDQDGRYDLLAGSFSGAIAWLANRGTVEAPQWSAPAPVWLGLDAGSNSAVEVADIDGDGAPDLFLAAENPATTGGYAIQRYRNGGAPWLPNWTLADRQFAGISVAEPAPRFVDIDGDGDLDLYVGDLDGIIHFYRNTGTTQTAVLVDETTGAITVGGAFGAMLAKPCFLDMDGDGDFDLLVGYCDLATLDGVVAYYENTGSRFAPVWAPPVDWSAALAHGLFPAIAASDADSDGLQDLVVGADTGEVYLHRRLTASPPTFASGVRLDFAGAEPCAVPALADLDGDLHPDLLVGGTYGGARLYRNPAANLTILPNHKTVATGALIDFTTSETVSGAWQIIANRSGATINPATGRYAAGVAAGVDIVRFGDTLTSCGVAYVNVLTAGQMSATGKAVIMAGRKSNDPLWSATNSLANSVYRLLLFKGYPKESIRYLNPDPSQDVDGNGLPDDIAAPSGLDAMEAAMTGWARGASGLAVYLIDHGQEESRSPYVRCNESEVLHASVLNPWFNGLQDSGVGLVTLVVDCCQSGGFLRDCHGGPGRPRVVIGSAAATEPAWFSAGGLISFSSAFVSSLYAGLTVGDAFAIAAAGMDPYQRPQLDDDGDGVYRPGVDGALARSATLGAADLAGADRPRLGLVCANQTLTSGAAPVTIWASETCSAHPLDRVWAAIAPPRLNPEAATRPGDPVLDTPELDLAWDAASHRYEATTNTFTQLGAYRVSVYARDIWGGVSYPKQTYVNQRLADEKMVIVCCDGDYDANSSATLSAFVADTAYGAARARWLEDGDITYLTPFAAPGKDGPPSKSALEAAIADANGAGQFTVFLIGGVNGPALRLDAASASDDLAAAELDACFDALQGASCTRVVAVLDFARSGDWLTSLTAPLGKERVIVASCGRDETSWCEQGGALCFSQYYFGQMREGANARDAFDWARAAMRAVTHETQSARLDDDGSGGATKRDGALAAATYLGGAYVPEVEAPVIGACARDVVLTSGSATLWASGVWDKDGIARVFAQVVPPGATATSGQTEEVELLYSSSMARWQADYARFDPSANQSVIYFAQDRTGQLSPPYVTAFGPAFGGRDDVYDRFYADDTTGTLNFISRGGDVQVHNFWAPGDEDWAVFSADAHSLYTIQVTDQAANCDAIIYLYEESDLQTPVAARDDHWAGGEDEVISWDSGSYRGAVFVKVSQSPDALELGGNATTYTLRISGDWGDNSGLATISPTTMATIGPSEGTLSAGAGGVYTQHSLNVPEGALSASADVMMDSTGDVGNSPYYAYTSAWLTAHPHNASLCQIAVAAPVSLSVPASITIQFVNDNTTFPEFPIADLPEGASPSDMRIYTWTGSQWQPLGGPQVVNGSTVTGQISGVGEIGHELGFSISLFAVAPGAASPTPSPTASATPSPTANPTASISPLPSPSPSVSPSPTVAPTPTATSAPSPTLSPSPTPVPTPSASRIKDNLLGQGDLSEAEKKAADVNGDGKLDIADVISWIHDHATTPTAQARRGKASGH